MALLTGHSVRCTVSLFCCILLWLTCLACLRRSEKNKQMTLSSFTCAAVFTPALDHNRQSQAKPCQLTTHKSKNGNTRTLIIILESSQKNLTGSVITVLLEFCAIPGTPGKTNKWRDACELYISYWNWAKYNGFTCSSLLSRICRTLSNTLLSLHL